MIVIKKYFVVVIKIYFVIVLTDFFFGFLTDFFFGFLTDFFFGAVKKHWGVLHGYKPWKIKFSWGFYSSHSTGFYIKTESAKSRPLKSGLYPKVACVHVLFFVVFNGRHQSTGVDRKTEVKGRSDVEVVQNPHQNIYTET